MNDAASFHFEILSGLYSGLTGTAAVGTTLIGSALDADLVFVEQRLEPHHLRITTLCNSIEIEAVAAKISIEGHENVAAGECVVVSLPAVIHAGEMSIRWSVQQSTQACSIAVPRIWIAALVSVLVGCVGIGASSTMFFNDDSAGALSPDSRPGVELAPKPTLNSLDDRTTQKAAELLQGEVDRAGLRNIKIGSGLGVVAADGIVTPSLVPRWREVQQWFDRHTNGTPPLVNGVVVKEEKALFSIAPEAVWRGAQPYLLIGGQKYFVGALLNDGWTLDRIEEGRVLLSRNGQLAALPY
ncbi:hypothetical protein [Bradyrhizobium sp. WSM3983]|uniref:SctD/MshK family protein n=1 Tax=Bradyrhizobium sp. WSM3983 TaxID=1038867 RepID=UPI0004896F2A|nr:hypothetical protein [Bradyrhizobium sp. WSM3983]